MKILHVTPHLGGGVGKAHAALRGALPRDLEQTFLLLEEPRDRRYADAIASGGALVSVARDLAEVAQRAADSDIVQFEFWNHPRLFECLARAEFPPIRTLFWSHISGLHQPLIPPGLMAQAGRFVFSTAASRSIPAVAGIAADKIAVINSGFGFSAAPLPAEGGSPHIAYLGTVDFVKMHPGFFDVIDALECNVVASVWGAFDPNGAAAARARAMMHPERIRFRGQTATPAQALSEAGIFFYPLQPEHYGTAENALVEAMSLGLAPVVLNNAAEAAIVEHGKTGLIAGSVAECVPLLGRLLASRELRARLGRNAARHIAETRTPAHSAREFVALWTALAGEAPRQPDFARALGATPADWFLATRLPGVASAPPLMPERCASKGTLAHFESVFTGDNSMARLRGEPVDLEVTPPWLTRT